MSRLLIVLAVAPACADVVPAVTDSTAALAASCKNGAVDGDELCPGSLTSITDLPMVRTVVVDLDGDGRRDIAAISQVPARAFVRLATATGWGTWQTWTIAASRYVDLAAGDFDADGDPDLAIADFDNDRVLVHWNPGTGKLLPPVAYAVGDGPVRVLAGRLNADARVDLVTLDENADTASVRLSIAGGFAAPVAYAVADAHDLALGNCDGANRADLIYSNGAGTFHQVVARRNVEGTGFFGPPIGSLVPLPNLPVIPLNHPMSIAAGDLDADGFADAVIPTDDSWVVPATSNGNCTFSPDPAPLLQTWAYVRRPNLVDLDGDGALDLMAPHLDDAMSAVFGSGAGGFSAGAAVLLTELFALPQNVWDIAPADVTGDGRIDYVLAGDAGVFVSRGVP